MARYTNQLMIQAPVSEVRHSLVSALQSCGLDLVYQTRDYLMAKEQAGAVSYWKLAVIEVLIDTPHHQAVEMPQVNLVVRNEELTLQPNNHCQQIFEAVNQAISGTMAATSVFS